MDKNPEGHSPRYWNTHKEKLAIAKAEPMPIPSSRSPKTGTPHLPLDIVTFLLLIAGYVLPLQEIMPLWIDIIVVLGAIIGGGFVLRRWEKPRDWSPAKQYAIGILAWAMYSASFMPGLYKQYERDTHMEISFKEDPRFNWWYKWLIKRNLVKTRDYLRGLGLPVPEETPPISIEENGQLRIPFNGMIYRGQIGVGPRAMTEGNIHAFTAQYISYVMLSILKMNEPRIADQKSQDAFNNELTFGSYFQWAYWGTSDGKGAGFWSRPLWYLREHMDDKKYVDKLAATTLRSFADSPEEGRGSDFDVYFCKHLRIGDEAIDGGMRRWPEIVKTLGVLNPGYSSACRD